MTKNEALFKVNGKKLYREKNLIDIQFPVFFVCIDDNNQRYLVLLADFDNDEYIICPVSNINLYEMLQGIINMRSPFERAKCLYYVFAGKTPASDKVEIVKVSNIEDDILPEKDAKFIMDKITGLKEYCMRLNPVVLTITKNFELKQYKPYSFEFDNSIADKAIEFISDNSTSTIKRILGYSFSLIIREGASI